MKRLSVIFLLLLSFSSPTSPPGMAVASVAVFPTPTPLPTTSPTSTPTSTPTTTPTNTITPTSTPTATLTPPPFQTPRSTATPGPMLINTTPEQVAAIAHAFVVLRSCDPSLEQYVLARVRYIRAEPGDIGAHTDTKGTVFLQTIVFTYPQILPSVLLHEAFHNSGVPNALDEDAAAEFSNQCDWSRYFPP